MPSRTDVPEYQKLRSMVHEIVGRINGQFGTLTYVPIYHLDTSLSFTELCALYAVTDVALVSSLVSACARGGGGEGLLHTCCLGLSTASPPPNSTPSHTSTAARRYEPGQLRVRRLPE